MQTTAPSRARGPDTPTYVGPALSLATRGRFLSAPDRPGETPERRPGYPAFLAFFFRRFGPTPAPAIAAQILLSVLTAAFAYAIARDLWDERAAALGWALLFGTLLATATLVRPTSYSLMVPALLLLGLGFRVRGHRGRDVVFILFVAAFALVAAHLVVVYTGRGLSAFAARRAAAEPLRRDAP